MNSVFLDTVGLLALWNRRDQWHDPAMQAYRQFLVVKAQFFTSPYVLLECGNAAARRPFRPEVDLLRQRLHKRGQILVPTDDDTPLAWEAFNRGEADEAGIVDHFSFLLMRRHGLTQAFTNDHHFRAAGFQTLF